MISADSTMHHAATHNAAMHCAATRTSSAPRRTLSRLAPSVTAALAAAALVCAGPAAADTITLNPSADATLISSMDGQEYAIGAGPNVFCGRVGTNGEGTLRRAMLRFNLSAIPPGSTITSVSLKVYMAQTSGGAQNCTLHRVTESWGESSSFAFGGGGTNPEPGDTTWKYRFWPTTLWATQGGSFVATASATKSINGVGFWTFTTVASLVADVQGWVNTPSSNHGWLMKGNEVTLQSAKKFDSRESTEPTRRPLLTVTYTPAAPPVPGDLNGDQRVNGADLGLLLAAWGSSGSGDLDNNGIVNGADLGLLLTYWTN